MQTRDVIVIGSSMGGIRALTTLVAQFPADLPASVLVVQHISEESPGVLSEILQRNGPLPAVTATDGMSLERGRIYVAPSGRHLLATPQGVRIVFGARENRSRPAIDPLFRTAAVHFRNRVIGVVLTGLLGDGSAGLYAVARCGGAAVIQSPDDAAYPEMPRRALDRVRDAHVVALSEMGQLIDRLSRQTAPPAPEVPEALAIEARLTERVLGSDDKNELPGKPTSFTCPECSGAIKEIEEGDGRRYRCRVGHAYAPDDFLVEKTAALEDTLWMALQTLEERAAMLSSMAQDDRSRGWLGNAERYETRAREAREHAERLPYRTMDDRIEGVVITIVDVSILKRSEKALHESEQRERVAASRDALHISLAGVEEDERRRLSRELHDEVGQHVTALGLGLQALSDVAPSGSEVDRRATELRRLVDTMGRELHEIAVRLRPKALDDFGLEAALGAYAEEWSRQSGVALALHVRPEAERLPAVVENAVYRVVQEALTNVAKHSGAKRAGVVVERRNGQVHAIVEDDGKGFDGARVPARRPKGKGEDAPGLAPGLGLLGIRERVELLGGTLEIESTPTRGTTLFARIPLGGNAGGHAHPAVAAKRARSDR